MIECFACGVSFKVEFEDEDTKLNYCPHCGQESIDEIIVEDLENVDDYYFDDDDK